MSLQTETYTDLTALTESFLSANLKPEEISRFDMLINQAARRAYRQHDYWERYLVVGEPRSAARQDIVDSAGDFVATKRTTLDGTIEATETGIDAVEVTMGATVTSGEADVLGIYQFDGYHDGLNKFKRVGKKDSYYLIYDNSDATWYLTDEPDSATRTEFMSVADGGSVTLPTAGWAGTGFTSPTATYSTTTSVVDTWLRIHKSEPFLSERASEYEFYATGGDCKLHTSTGLQYVYATYKKQHSDTYGDGTGSTTATIPAEWFHYMAYYAAYYIQVSLRQIDVQNRTVSKRELNDILVDELIKLNRQHISDKVARRTRTGLNHSGTY